MELKNIFKMTKTDRYTQDGRDELAKLQETEDVKYKTGDISQKTGLQKQPDGSWAPPKNAGKNVHGAEIDKIYEKHQKRIKELKAKGYTDEQIENDKIYQQTKEDMRNVGKSKPEEKSLAGTPMKKADLNSKDPYEITHSMKPDTASEAKEMDKISAFMQEETGATLRNAITARESFYKNTKNPTPEQQEGLAALMKIQQKLGYGKPAESPVLNGQKKTVSYQEMQKGPLYGPAGGVSRAQKEEAIRKDLDLRGEHDLDRFSDEQIEMMYQKSQRTPEQQKADFDNSKLGQAYNKARKEYDDHQAAYKNRQRMRDAEKEIGVAESLERMYKSRGLDSEAAAAREYRNAAENLKALTGLVENLPRNTEPDAELQQKIQDAQKKLDEARVKARPQAAGDSAPRILTGDTKIRIKK